jgi:DNA polymerase elongation subunit (family B)
MEVISVEEVDAVNTVYDLETEAGTFVAGGIKYGILVKNTDSCYVKFPIHKSDYEKFGDKQEEEFMKANFDVAQKCADFCTSQFPRPIELAFENFKYPFILFAKKRYAYKEWTDPLKPDDEIHYKGIQLVRRDTCRYVKEELNNAFELIMNQKSKENAKKAALPFIQRSIQNLLDGNVDFNKLVLSKQLKSKYVFRENNISNTFHWSNPKITQPHVRLAQQLKTKNPANHPKPPDRVPYLFVEKKDENLLQCDKVIHPEEFNQGKNKIDSLYYFKHQYEKAIDMVFQFMVLDKKGNSDTKKIYKDLVISKINKLQGQPEITSFFKQPEKEKENFLFVPESVEYVADSDEDDYGYDYASSSDSDDSYENGGGDISENLF